uniref:Leucine-rich repeat-containing N-terminal plant-type domain-containing protein n=1 Tax=Picea sitchensis TaxID=3332 RepID=A9NW70_PICSI|nr:unknown [Picea sitchensis]
MKTRFNMKKWISDPCYLIPWEGIGCDNRSSEVRISEINLSGRNLTIPVPEEIGQLTALVNLSLENNHLMGPLPNFSSLTMLERLYLQNNSLNGSVPDWLSGLKNLKELFIQNNNFSGVIPAQLLLNRSLKLIRSGNPYLCVHKGDCILPNSNKNKKRVVLGITLGGILIIAVALIVGIVVYRKKFRRKGGVAAKSSGMKTNEEISYF